MMRDEKVVVWNRYRASISARQFIVELLLLLMNHDANFASASAGKNMSPGIDISRKYTRKLPFMRGGGNEQV